MYTVLIIDDDKALRQLVAEVLELLELNILEAGDGVAGFTLLDREGGKVDLILLDVFMPEMDGMEFLKKIKVHPAYKNIPVVMLTAAVDKVKMLEAIRGGAKHYLTKPFNSEDLLTRVVQVLGIDIL
jgi:two-component system, chemotaxis family, chemotaxis protein CheY